MSSIPSEELRLSDLNFEDELKSTVDQILQACPRFRILVLGRSGVGKSHLINAVFRTELTDVEHGRTAGVSDIEQEITSEQNTRLILHDSQGFSHGDPGNFEIVQTFIEQRSKMALKDRLHAIWLCTEVPTYDGSLLEFGDERILRLKDRGVPIVAVFTKYDVLVNSLIQDVTPATEEDLYGDIEEDIDSVASRIDHDTGSTIGPRETPIDPSLLSRADEKLRNEMIKPFEQALVIPWVAVSVRPNFSSTLNELVQKTEACIDQSVRITWAITQQQSVDMKIDSSIKVGKRKYWQGLSTSFILPGRSLAKWLKVVHGDIVKVWGFHDPDMVLTSAATAMSRLQEGLVEEEKGAMQNLSFGALTGTAALVSVMVPPAAPFALPIVSGVVFVAWVYNAVKVTPSVLRGMMGYIVDLTIVMQSLFLLMQAHMEVSGSASPVTQRLFDLALRAYRHDIQHSPQKVHEEIRSFATRKKAFLKHEEVMAEVVRLIRVHRFKPSELFMAEAMNYAGSPAEAC